jgi:asparagine synthase (glutamine-hydrolysing)
VCGIFGVFGSRISRSTTDVVQATTLLSHRGPDGGAYWIEPPFAFGHRRLSIIDVAQGAQPMADASRRYVITFNGEIYNYIELRDELRRAGCSFRTNSDTEVILEGYRRYGVEVASKLVGMFAFAIADRMEQTLYLARDHLGEKPLYLWHTPAGDVVFASELKAITSLTGFVCKIDPSVLGAYLMLNYVPGERSLLCNVSRLAAGTWALLQSDGRCRQAPYWTPLSQENIAPNTPRGGIKAVDELAQRLDAAVHIALRSDVPVALFLSGGVDSSLVAESAMRQGYLRHAYCLDFEDARFSEWRNAKRVADQIGVELRRAVARPLDPDQFDRLIYHLDDPLADSSAVALDALSRVVAEDYKVAMSGDGGDELFGGYLTYQATALYRYLSYAAPAGAMRSLARVLGRLTVNTGKVSALYRAMRFLRAWGLAPGAAHFTWNGAWLADDALTLLSPDLRITNPPQQALDQLLHQSNLDDKQDLRSLQIADMLNYLPNDILTKVDRTTMAYGVETRAPFLNPTLAEFGLALDDAEKVGHLHGRPKRILRALAARVFPKEISAAKKQGFSVPIHQWLRKEMRAVLEVVLSKEALARMPFIDPDAVAARKVQHVSGTADLGFELWGVMVLSTWWSHHASRLPTRKTPAMPIRRIEFPAIEA